MKKTIKKLLESSNPDDIRIAVELAQISMSEREFIDIFECGFGQWSSIECNSSEHMFMLILSNNKCIIQGSSNWILSDIDDWAKDETIVLKFITK